MKFFKLSALLPIVLLAGCGGSNEGNKVVEKSPPVTPSQVDSTPPEGMHNPVVAPTNPSAGGTPADTTKAPAGEKPEVVEKPATPTTTPKPE